MGRSIFLSAFGVGFQVQSIECTVQALKFIIQGSGFWVQG
jgi:hypothetical protein